MRTVGKQSFFRKWWFYVLILAGIAFVGEIVLFTAVVVQADRLDNPRPADAIIVLGARISPDSSPSPALERRLDLARALYANGMAPLIITTGAQGDDEPLPEGEGMRDYLIANGVPGADIVAENASYNTRENLANAQAIMTERGLSTAIIVTSDYHLWRALSICGDLGLAATGAGSQNALTLPVAIRNCLQETLSWVKYVLIG